MQYLYALDADDFWWSLPDIFVDQLDMLLLYLQWLKLSSNSQVIIENS